MVKVVRNVTVGALLGGIAGFALCAAGQDTPQPARTPGAVVISEDDPRWDCQTMGNRQCGAVSR